jgi:hypothetical protein
MTMHTERMTSRPVGMLPNSRFPLLIHRGGVPGGGVGAVLERFRGDGWLNTWRHPGIYGIAISIPRPTNAWAWPQAGWRSNCSARAAPGFGWMRGT